MKVAIMQPYLFPFIGYFQMITAVDKILLLDDVSYINKGWINRNRILINGQTQYFIMPVEGVSQNKIINSLYLLQDNKWRKKLEKTISMAYKKGIGFNDFFPVLKEILEFKSNHLSEYLFNSIYSICNYLDIKTELIFSTSIYHNNYLKGQDRIIDLCLKEKATTYINAAGGKLLYDSDRFAKSVIELYFLQPQFSNYKQIVSSTFVPGLSIIDMLMNCPKEFVQQELNHFILE